MQVGVKALNSEVFFKKLREPLDDRFLLFRAVAAAKAGDGRQDLVNIRAGRFERAVAERIGNKALRLPVVFFIQQGGSSLRRSRLKIFLLYFAPQFSVYTKFRTDPFATGG